VVGGAAAVAAQLAAEAQPSGRTPRVGVVAGASPDPLHPVRGLREGLRDAGYIEGDNIIIEYRWARGRLDRIPGLVAELLAMKVDVLVAGNTAAAVEAKKANQAIPIVMAFVSDPVRRGLIASFDKPGGNVTGMSPFALEMTAKQVELLKETLPNASRFAVLWNPSYEPSADHLRRAQTAAAPLGLQLHPVAARGHDELEAAFAATRRARAEAMLVVADPTFFIHRSRLAELATTHRLPTMFGFREHAEAGGLMAYASDAADLYRRSAHYVAKILKGARPSDLPVQQPTKFELVINLRAARALGLAIPPSLLLRADQVLE